MQYRAEIDGLRALAVLPVILFHAGFEWFSGGFVGVDVFFVISGYLITIILIEDIENRRFSIVNFYERRARRILPALFFVMLLCIPFAWMWMLPEQMKDFSQSLIAVSLFASNILFWQESGYFDAVAEEKPLLHTWSLAVEEQYYLLFPIFLILVWRFGKNKVFWMIVVIASISLMLSEWGWRNKPSANFYLSPSRAWELFAGSIAAFIVQKKGVKKNNPLALLGLFSIVFSVFFYDETTPFPSIYALVPVIGVVMLILYADKETLAAKLLSTKGFVAIGLTSYSAYLWHQPLFAFTRIKYGELQSIEIAIVLILCSFLLAFFSWKYVEAPFRNKTKISRKVIFLLSVIGMVTFIIIGILGHKSEGFPNRFKNNAIFLTGQAKLHGNYGLSSACEKNFVEGGECATSETPEILVWGDSYAMHLVPGILSSNRDARLQQATVSQCAPIINFALVTAIHGAQNCIAFNDSVFQYLSDSTVKYVVLSSPFERFYDNRTMVDSEGRLHSNGAEITLSGLLDLVERIRKLGKIPVIFTPPPSNGKDLGNCLLRNELRGYSLNNCDFERENISPIKSEITRTLQSILTANVVDLTSLICDREVCSTSLEGVYLFRDTGHLSYEGSTKLGETYDFYNLIVSTH
jgi:peptidoglycan/LPS O-acetylase OafA/YrhL